MRIQNHYYYVSLVKKKLEKLVFLFKQIVNIILYIFLIEKIILKNYLKKKKKRVTD